MGRKLRIVEVEGAATVRLTRGSELAARCVRADKLPGRLVSVEDYFVYTVDRLQDVWAVGDHGRCSSCSNWGRKHEEWNVGGILESRQGHWRQRHQRPHSPWNPSINSRFRVRVKVDRQHHTERPGGTDVPLQSQLKYPTILTTPPFHGASSLLSPFQLEDTPPSPSTRPQTPS